MPTILEVAEASLAERDKELQKAFDNLLVETAESTAKNIGQGYTMLVRALVMLVAYQQAISAHGFQPGPFGTVSFSFSVYEI